MIELSPQERGTVLRVKVFSGETSREKRFLVLDLDPETFRSRLEPLMAKSS